MTGAKIVRIIPDTYVLDCVCNTQSTMKVLPGWNKLYHNHKSNSDSLFTIRDGSLLNFTLGEVWGGIFFLSVISFLFSFRRCTESWAVFDYLEGSLNPDLLLLLLSYEMNKTPWAPHTQWPQQTPGSLFTNPQQIWAFWNIPSNDDTAVVQCADKRHVCHQSGARCYI